MVRTTPPRPVDVEALFPELVPFRRPAIRLHPRPGTPDRHDSSVGGPLLWPADEPWPMCSGTHGVYWDALEETNEAVPLVAIVQIHRLDAPDVAFPAGADLLQVLWCPFIIDDCPSPTPRVYWRDSASITDVLQEPPAQVSIAPKDRIPSPCVVHPEAVVEYPSGDLGRDRYLILQPRFEALEADTGWVYDYHLAAAPGTKLGGYPSWKQQPYWPPCPTCGATMAHLLTVDSWEHDGESQRTWLPVEETDSASASTNPTGLMIGDAGGLYVFECSDCPDRPVGYHGDCS